MGKLLASLFTFFIGNFAARLLTGAGMAIVTVSWLGPMINSQVNSVVSSLNGIQGVIGSFIALSGIFVGMGTIITSIVARVSIIAAKNIMGVMRK